LKANQVLPKSKRVAIYGKANKQYVYFKLQDLPFEESYKGHFPKSFEAIDDILRDAKYCVDMSVIQNDGGGTQYTFLEAMYQGVALVINRRWVEGFKTPFIDKKNCFVVGDGEELAELLREDPPTTGVQKEALKILTPHIEINWLTKLNSYGSRDNKTRKLSRRDIRTKTMSK
jgi:hypothetical protein